jgi:hypothetical protein
MFTWLKAKWTSFEAWCASWMPGLKTYIVTGLGALGSLAAVLQEYITGLPLSEFMTGTQIAVATAVLFSLAFWTRHLTNVQS